MSWPRGNLPGSASSITSHSHLETVEDRTGLLVLELRNRDPEEMSLVLRRYFLKVLTGQRDLGPPTNGWTSMGGGVLPSL